MSRIRTTANENLASEHKSVERILSEIEPQHHPRREFLSQLAIEQAMAGQP